MAAILQHFLLTLNLVLQSFLNSLEGVDVLHLGTGTQHIGAFRADGNIQVSTEIALLHLAVGNINVLQNGLDLFHVQAGFLRGRHIRLGNNLNQRHAGTIVIHVGSLGILDGIAGMHQLACILLHVNTGDADALLALGSLNIHIAMLADWQIILGCLPVLRQVRIIIILAVKLGEIVNLAVQGKTCLDGKLQHPFIQHRQYPRQAKADRAYMGIMLRAEGGCTAAENLGIRL